MGQSQHTPIVKPVGGRLRPRTCLRKGCSCVFQPARWNQRYCQDGECLRQVRRWQAAKRQRVHRTSADNRKRHAEAEARRRQARAATASSQDGVSKSDDAGSAWSRSRKIPANFCDRPGCYEPLPTHSRAPTRYCSRGCRQALRRVTDRERKWLLRNRYSEQLAQRRDPLKASLPRGLPRSAAGVASINTVASPVGDYRAGHKATLSFPRLEPRSAEEDDNPETHLGRRSRPPPTH
jgi:hypothetical protein